MAGKRIDLTGQKFGRLTVIERKESDKYGNTLWLCKCECGNEKVTVGYSLKKGVTMSCGCLQKDANQKKVKDLTGQKFGRLTVIERAGTSKGRKALWLCKCECGNEKVIMGNNLKSGATMSCGCLGSEKMKQLNEEQWKDEDFRKMQSEISSKTIKKQWQDEDFRKMQSEKGKQQTKDKNPNYKGGITPISQYLRSLQVVRNWRKNTYVRENSKCQLTGKSVHSGNSDVHHLKGFNTIVREAHSLYNIQIKEIIAEYTDKELKLLEEYIVKWHKDTTNAVLLSDEIHNLFHSTYGSGNNTPEQFEEFKERYLAGEFKEILK